MPGGTRPPTGSEAVTFQLNGLDIRGATAFGAEDFAPIFESKLGGQITLATLFEMVADVETLYRDAGYVLSFAYLPPQETEDGVFILEVVEGFIASVAIEDVSDPEMIETLRGRFDALVAERPVHIDTLEEALAGANNGLGGFRISGVLQPSPDRRGGTDLIVSAEMKSFAADVEVNNRGTEYAGPMRMIASGELYNLGVLGDRLRAELRITHPTKELRGLSLAYDRPVDWIMPLVLHAGFSAAGGEAGGDLQAFEIESEVTNIDLWAEATPFEDVESKAVIRLGLQRRAVDTDILGTELARDRMGSVYLQGDYTHSGWLGGATTFGLQLEQGLPLFDTTSAGDPPSRSDAESDFTVARLRAAHLQPIHGDLYASFIFGGQYAFTPLYASKEYALGGELFGRAYDLGQAIGDHGVAAGVEALYDLNAPTSWIEKLQPYAFLDGGRVWDRVNGEPQTLGSTGLGMRMELPYGFRLGLEYAYALGPDPTVRYELGGMDLGRSRIFFSVGKSF